MMFSWGQSVGLGMDLILRGRANKDSMSGRFRAVRLAEDLQFRNSNGMAPNPSPGPIRFIRGKLAADEVG